MRAGLSTITVNRNKSTDQWLGEKECYSPDGKKRTTLMGAREQTGARERGRKHAVRSKRSVRTLQGDKAGETATQWRAGNIYNRGTVEKQTIMQP